MTVVLAFVIFGTAVSPRAPKVGGFGIGLAVLGDVLFGGPFTGAAMNPAKAMGPTLASLSIPFNLYILWIGLVVGALIAGFSYGFLFESRSRNGDK
jgi:aquaporin Z